MRAPVGTSGEEFPGAYIAYEHLTAVDSRIRKGETLHYRFARGIRLVVVLNKIVDDFIAGNIIVAGRRADFFSRSAQHIVRIEYTQRALTLMRVNIVGHNAVHHRSSAFIAVGIVGRDRGSGVFNRSEIEHPGHIVDTGSFIGVGLIHSPIHQRLGLYDLLIAHCVVALRKVLHMDFCAPERVAAAEHCTCIVHIELLGPVGQIAGFGEVDEVDTVAA